MINNQGRQEDLTKVFDRTWNANHNDVAKRGRERERKFMDKMFGTNRSVDSVDKKPLTPGQRAETLHNNINNAFSGQRQSNLNNIVKKWK